MNEELAKQATNMEYDILEKDLLNPDKFDTIDKLFEELNGDTRQ